MRTCSIRGAPWRYGTAQIIKAVRAAAAIGVPHVITTEGEPSTDFGNRLTEEERLLLIAENSLRATWPHQRLDGETKSEARGGRGSYFFPGQSLEQLAKHLSGQ